MKQFLLCKSMGKGLWKPTLLNSSYDHLFSPKSGHIIWALEEPISIAEINDLARSNQANIIWGD